MGTPPESSSPSVANISRIGPLIKNDETCGIWVNSALNHGLAQLIDADFLCDPTPGRSCPMQSYRRLRGILQPLPGNPKWMLARIIPIAAAPYIDFKGHSQD